MSGDQMSLFPDMDAPKEADMPRAVKQKEKTEKTSVFLPGIKLEESFKEIDDLDQLARLTRGCRRCSLREGCRQVVFAEGEREARLMFIGEAPGAEEDEAGVPFVGRAGQLLNRILDACHIERSEVYITNVVKCRPPGNRLPNPDEVRACYGYLEAQIRIIRPAIIVCLGALATQTVVDPKARITSSRGRWFNRDGVMIMPTFHPAALLRREEWKRPAWEDFKKIRDAYHALKGQQG